MGIFGGLLSMFDWHKLLADKDEEIKNEKNLRHELEARLLVVRAEMHQARNEANVLQQKLNLIEARNAINQKTE